MFNKEEIQAWEMEIDRAMVERFYGKGEKVYFDPRNDALIRHRNRTKWRRFKETPYARKKVQKCFKMRMKMLMSQESYHNPVPHEYRTYGWETW